MNRFFLALFSLPISVLAEGGLPDRPPIYVEGRAEIQKPADMLTLKFDLVGSAPDQAKASKVFAMLKERKVANSDVIAENIRAEPQFEQDAK
jgi:uncharacterized protein YggE